MSKKEDQKKLWDEILSEAMMDNKSKEATLIMVGSRGVGKRTLINTIHNLKYPEDTRKIKILNFGIENTYLDVYKPDDAEKELIGRINVWFLEDPAQKSLLDAVITKETLDHLMVAFVLDFSENWNFMNSMNEWMNIISEKIGNILATIPLHEQDNLRKKLYHFLQSYKPPTTEPSGGRRDRKRATQMVNLDLAAQAIDLVAGIMNQPKVPLPEGVLNVNYGVPFLVICNKADLIESIEKEKDGDRRLQFIEYSLRNYCIQYGAALVYVSCKQNINVDVLIDYIGHRVFEYKFGVKPDNIHRESVFIPSGYDTPKIITETYAPLIKETNVLFEEVVKPPPKRPVLKEDVQAEDNQGFLLKLKETLKTAKATSATAGRANLSLEQSNAPAPASGQSEVKMFYNKLLSTPKTRDNVNIEQGLADRASQNTANAAGGTNPAPEPKKATDPQKLLDMIKSKGVAGTKPPQEK